MYNMKFLLLMLQKCEKLLLYLFCSDLGSDFEEAESPSVSLQTKKKQD